MLFTLLSMLFQGWSNNYNNNREESVKDICQKKAGMQHGRLSYPVRIFQNKQ